MGARGIFSTGGQIIGSAGQKFPSGVQGRNPGGIESGGEYPEADDMYWK